MKGNIIVNATALDSSGALTILKQFLESIPDDQFDYFVFVNKGVYFDRNKSNVNIIHKNVKSLLKRLLWDTFGIRRWLKEKECKPLVSISLQNTNFRTKESIPNFIYYHNSIPFAKQFWNPFKKEERPLLFYKMIYPFFVKLFMNKNTEVFVQGLYVKKCFASFYDFPEEKIHVISPKFELPVFHDEPPISIDVDKLNLFYPATPFPYKNHQIIFDALSLLDKNLQKRISLYLTCEKHELKHLSYCSETLFDIHYSGRIPFNEILGMYKVSDALLFPSFIETLGIPLIEAASFGLPILAADLPYSREALKSYEGVSYAQYNDAHLWKDGILKLFSSKGKRYIPIKLEKTKSWEELFKIIGNKIKLMGGYPVQE